MKIPKLYLDTSVIGGYFDDEWKDATRELWQQMRAGKFRFVTSSVTLDEVNAAPYVSSNALNPACAKCRSAVSASVNLRSSITPNEMQSVSDQSLSARAT